MAVIDLRNGWGGAEARRTARGTALLPSQFDDRINGMYAVETEQEVDGRWIAEVPELPGVMAYGKSRDEALRRAQALSLRVLADRLELDEQIPTLIKEDAILL